VVLALAQRLRELDTPPPSKRARDDRPRTPTPEVDPPPATPSSSAASSVTPSPPRSPAAAAAPALSSGQVALTAEVPVSKRGIILGRNSSTIRRIVAVSGAFVVLPKAHDPSTTVRIEGTPAQARAAKQAIDELVAQGFSALLLPPGHAQALVHADGRGPSQVFGRGGALVKQITAATGATVTFHEDGPMAKCFQILGPAAGVARAEAAVAELVRDGLSELTHGDWVRRAVPFPVESRSYLIGAGGATIRAVDRETGCRVLVPRDDAPEVVIAAPSNAHFAAAAARVEALRERAQASW
jgi:rRNA processing protein Krr1/Pno1